jgi:hypothetical protein
MLRIELLLILACVVGTQEARAEELKAGAAAAVLTADDSMIIGGGIGPGKAHGQEGELRASAVVIHSPAGERAALIACDVLMIERDILDRAAGRIVRETGIPFDHILINATHTHHAPTTVTVHGYSREEPFTRQVEDRIVEAAVKAARRLAPVTCRFRLGEESSVGKNSRLLLNDGMIYWVGSRADALRPTGPFDPELPVMAFRRADGPYEAILFNHSTHTIGTQKPGVRSPSYYGLAAQEIEKEKGGTVLFFEGASGSTHNLDLSAVEATYRIKQAVTDGLEKARDRRIERVQGIRKEIDLRVREFDETEADRQVVVYCTKRIPDANGAQGVIDTFRAMRKVLAPRQGEIRKTWVQAITLGDVAIVGVPGEFFTLLGQEIKRRSPYRYTFVFELANDYVGYVPDAVAFDHGGYQVWMGLHSFLQRGSGEIIVEEAVGLLERLHGQDSRPVSP